MVRFNSVGVIIQLMTGRAPLCMWDRFNLIDQIHVTSHPWRSMVHSDSPVASSRRCLRIWRKTAPDPEQKPFSGETNLPTPISQHSIYWFISVIISYCEYSTSFPLLFWLSWGIPHFWTTQGFDPTEEPCPSLVALHGIRRSELG